MVLAPQAPGDAENIIVANRSRMTAKHTTAGVATIDAALFHIAAVDAVRGLTTTVVSIDDQVQMITFGLTPIINAADEGGAKRIVDAIDAKISPDCFLLLDGPDITMSPMPGLNDGDSDERPGAAVVFPRAGDCAIKLMLEASKKPAISYQGAPFVPTMLLTAVEEQASPMVRGQMQRLWRRYQ
jgi:hypothetical protein